MAEIDQLFDLNTDPSAKQRLLSGAYNLVQCPSCGYQGNLAAPIVYHDPDKELLLSYVPAELGLPRDEQERIIGSLINQVMKNLPQEKRKGYLLNPQANLTMQGLVERVLEKDGITREMLQAQQQRLSLIQRMASITDKDTLEEVARQEDAQIDAEFFTLISRLAQAAMSAGDQGSARRLAELQRSLLPITSFGHEVQNQSREVESAMADLRSLGNDLNRESLLKLILEASNEIRLGALVSLARPVMDYAFFQLLSERIDQAGSDEQPRLLELRQKLLEMTQEIDQQMENHKQETRQVIEAVLQTPNIDEAMQQVLPAVDDYFLQELNNALNEARRSGNLERSAKLQQMLTFIQEASAPPPELALLEEFLELEDDASRRQFLKQHDAEITPEMLEMLGSITAQVQSGEDAEFAARATAANRLALRYMMERNLRSS
jgi:hypothetical protein